MTERPLNLNWKDLLPDLNADESAPPPELVAVPPSHRSDCELQEAIQSISHIVAATVADQLPDKGQKLQSALREVSDQIDPTRSLSRIQKGVGECAMATERNSGKSSSDMFGDLGLAIIPDSELNRDFESTTDAAFSEELRFMSHDKYEILRDNEMESQDQTRVSSRELPTKKNKCCLFKDKLSDIRPSNICSSHAGKAFSRRSSKRRRVPSKRVSTNLKFVKVQHIVLLDDENVEPVQSEQHCDTSDNWCDPECVELSYLDLKCLDPESYLSSPIMNFYIECLQRSESSMTRQKGECYIFNTYFYNKLEEAMTCKDDRTTSFLKLRRWWKGVDIFRKAYIFLPIHGGMHWSLVIICIPAKEDDSSLIILHLDSLGVHASYQIFSIVARYLKEEWKYINQNGPPSDLPISEKIWKYLPCWIEREKVMVPQQKNDYDCGLFVLYFIERFLKEAPERLRKKDLSMFGRKWFDPEEASQLREIIQDLAIKVLKANSIKNESQEPLESTNGEEESNQIQFTAKP